MDLSNLTKEENQALVEFSDLYSAEKYEEALKKVEWALEQFPTSQAIWESQIGAMVVITSGDYLTALPHYERALQGGFDAEVCEDNIWEAAEEHYNSLKKEDGTFNAILYLDETETAQSRRANYILQRYVELFPQGKYQAQATKLLAEFESATN